MTTIQRYRLFDFPADVYTNCIGDSLFASPEFMALWRHQGGKPVVWAAQEKGECVAVLPGLEFGMTGLKRFQSLPDGLYTRVYPPDREKGDPAHDIVDAIGKGGYAKAFLFDFYGTLGEHNDFDVVEHETSVVDISDTDWEPQDKKIQSEIRKAEREGISIEPIDPEKHLDRFLTLMRDTEARHGRGQKYSGEFFRALARLSVIDQRVVWLWCEHEGRGAASHIFLVEGDMALHWQVYFDKQFSFLKPNQYILFTQAHGLRERGVTRLNLGASLPEAEGLIAYKEKWGGAPVRYHSLVRKSGVGRLF